MFLPDPGSNGDFAQPPAGNHVATCYRFIDLGTQLNISDKYGNKEQRTVQISWELPTELMDDGKPFSVSKWYNWSMNEKSKLREHLEAWRGRAFVDTDFAGPDRFNIKKILGTVCMINVVLSEKGKAKVAGIAAFPKGVMARPDPINPPVYFSLDPPFFDAKVLDSLSDYLKEKIKGSPEYQLLMANGSNRPTASRHPAVILHSADEEIPF